MFLAWIAEHTATFGLLAYTLLTDWFRTTEVETEISARLGYYAVYRGNSLPTFRDFAKHTRDRSKFKKNYAIQLQLKGRL